MKNQSQIIGNSTSVASRLTSLNGTIRPEVMLDCLVSNNTGGALWMQFFDGLNAVPANATVPTFSFPVPAKTSGTLGRPVSCDGGIWVWSSTDNALTAAGASGSIVVVMRQ